MKKFKNIKFIRYGNLKVTKQTHYIEGKNKPFHNPPVNIGFFAMPYIRQEPYIISDLAKTQPQFFKKSDNLEIIRWYLFPR